jgi:hypothetical protein
MFITISNIRAEEIIEFVPRSIHEQAQVANKLPNFTASIVNFHYLNNNKNTSFGTKINVCNYREDGVLFNDAVKR